MRLGLVGGIVSLGFLVGAPVAAALAPDTTITSGPADRSLTRDTTPTFTFSASQPATFACSMDAEGEVVTFGCASPYTAGPLTDGMHIFRVAATNTAGETDSSLAARGWTIDTTPPETTILEGPAEGQVINTDAPAFRWQSSENGSTYRCVTDGIPLMSCDLAFAASTRAGRHSFSVAATDPAGNTDPTPATRTFTVSLRGAPPPLPRCQYDGNLLIGTSGPDTRNGTRGTDVMYGLAGNDVLRAGAGQDCLSGGNDNDRLFGDAGQDFISGGNGNDNLVGGPGNDELRAGTGNDRVTGSAGLDVLYGDAGNDRLSDGSGRDTFDGGAGNDRITSRDNNAFGRRASDTVRCGKGFDVAIVDKGDLVAPDCERVVKR
jgi:Ca2+-binding RTX toxin-like protein